MVEVAGKIVEQSVSVLIDPRSTHSYITPRVANICVFKKLKHRNSWLVQLATGTKRKVSEMVKQCPLVMNGLVTMYIGMFYRLVPMMFSLEWIGWKLTE